MRHLRRRPRPWLDRHSTGGNDIRHDRDEWRAESRLKDAQIVEQNKQLDHLEAVGHAVDAVMRAIQKGAAPEVPS